MVQSMPDASPVKWHLAHTTWFFETFVLENDRRSSLYNSYYETVGDPFPRPKRGQISRPTLDEVLDYRKDIDARVTGLLDDGAAPPTVRLVELGLHHEQQHQELILSDIKHAFWTNPLRPRYRKEPLSLPVTEDPPDWFGFKGGLRTIGHGGDGFAFDNERPDHRVFLEPFEIASRPVTCREYLAFMEDGGYERPELWLSLGLEEVRKGGWKAPLYWEQRDGQWRRFTLGGMKPIDPHLPVCHLSYYEADAYARWAGARLPTEQEWETAAPSLKTGDVWEWTSSAYGPYPGYTPPEGALAEYNGKFMCNQFVLRGGSCATPNGHVRPTYRNFWPPDTRWQFTGIRMARTAEGGP